MYIFQSVRMWSRSWVLVCVALSSVSALVALRRLTARSSSVSDRKSLLGFAGVPGQMNTPAIATGIVMRELIMNIHLKCRG